MKDKIVVGLEFNSQGEVIENSGYEVLDSDKELIFNFLNQQDWYYEEFFTPAMTLYKKGLLNLETDMDITLR